MNWFYALDDQRHGPVTEAQLIGLYQRGAINLATPVWTVGMADWQTLELTHQQGRLLVPGAASGASAARPCAVCQAYFPPDEVIRLDSFWVCAQCKPAFLQRLQEGATLVTRQVWRHRRQLVARDGTAFPDRCIRCNAPTGGYRVKCELRWAPPFGLVSSPRRAVVHVGICQRHRRQRGRIVAVSCIVLLLGGASLFLAPAWGILLGLTLLLGGFFVGGIAGRLVTAVRIENEFAFLKGAGRPFLDSLPEWTNRS